MRGNLCAARAVLVRARMWSASRQCLLVIASLPAACAGTVKTLRRHICTLLLRQQRRCGVTLSDCCCGSRDVAASHSHAAVAAAETLRRHTLNLLLRQQRRCGVALSDLLLRQQRPCSVTLRDHCSGSTASAVVVDMSHQLLRRSQHRACVGAHWAHAGQTSLAAAASSNCLR